MFGIASKFEIPTRSTHTLHMLCKTSHVVFAMSSVISGSRRSCIMKRRRRWHGVRRAERSSRTRLYPWPYAPAMYLLIQRQTPRYARCRLPSRIHIIVLLLILLHRLRYLLLLQQFLPIERTRRIELQPRLNAFQIKYVVLVACESHDERMRIYEHPKRSASATGQVSRLN